VLPEPAITRVAAPLREQVAKILHDDIVSAKLEPGQRLVESTLCARFQVSRAVVREALRQLEAEGLVNTIPHRGPVVATLTIEEARDLYETRACLEALAAALFAQRATSAQREQLTTCLTAMKSAFASDDPLARLWAKDDFYRVMLDGSGNAVVAATLRGIHARVQRLRALSLQAPGRPLNSLADLTEITEAAVAGDSARASERCEAHVSAAAKIALAMLETKAATDPEQ
jgi:DNA-binding GntR family transcriptional regulator